MTIRDVIEKHGHFAHGGNPDDTAETWAESGFEADEVDEWLLARCFDPSSARDIAYAGGRMTYQSHHRTEPESRLAEYLIEARELLADLPAPTSAPEHITVDADFETLRWFPLPDDLAARAR